MTHMFFPYSTLVIALLMVAEFVSGPHPAWWLDLDAPLWWQPLTALFVHADRVHLLSNLSVLLAAGCLCEMLHGPARLAAVFAYAGAGGNLAYGWFRHSQFSVRGVGPGASLGGASGAALGILGAHSAHLMLNWAETPRWLRRGWAGVLLLCVASEVVAYAAFPQPRIAYTAHTVGAAHGALFGAAVLRNVVSLPWEVIVRRASLLLSLTVLLGSGLGLFVA